MIEGRQILLADDDEQVHRAVTRVAEKLGYNVIHVTTGGDVVTRAIETKPELIVLDVSFPDADGRDVLTVLKAVVVRNGSKIWAKTLAAMPGPVSRISTTAWPSVSVDVTTRISFTSVAFGHGLCGVDQ